ncbi:Rrf2 family transcriptional regulator [Thiospirochaeta perfilievii]|uniref:Rrf2 family transcriptional regulator n=1 Tax=Thiospirochaeta perfilievii TaxID=252967 RepID=A0A5C1QFF4_9SPIO|nr:Rrf2 family transcriptional regulator [Thiospirochaeta perfilievii]QEN05364.1 Rrf2 family transcriptional regulator [Thiospirochaeta perfilievii]
MNISTKTRYGFRLMVYLGLNETSGEPTQLGEIAEKEGLSLKYLEKIVQMLKRNGLVTVKRGPKGGYSLASESGKISLLSIYEALEGSCAVVECTDGNICDRQNLCSTANIWCDLSNVISNFFSERTLRDIINEQDKKSNMFYI